MNGCSKYDDSALWNEVNDLKARLTKLEEQVNARITNLQELVEARTKKYVTDVLPVPNSEKPDYYLITFSDNTSITINNGVDGEDGVSPQISVEEEDGIFYWKINDQWLEDGAGNKVRVTGNDGASGADGTTPKIRINSSGYWEICSTGDCPDDAADNTGGWESTDVKATGTPGNPGEPGTPGMPGDNGVTPKIRINSTGYWEICSTGNCSNNAADNTGGWESTSVKATGNNGVTPKLRINATNNYWQVCITGTCVNDSEWENVLGSDGQPVKATGDPGTPGTGSDGIFSGIDTTHDGYVIFTLVGGGSISLPKYTMDITFTQPAHMTAGSSIIIPYTLSGGATVVRVFDPPKDWTVEAKKDGPTNGFFIVKAPATFNDENNAGEATIFISDGHERTAIRTLTLYTIDGITEPTYAYSGQIWVVGIGATKQYWSDIVNIPACSASTYIGNKTDTPECLKNANDYPAYYYNASYVKANSHALCSDGWRVPTREDFIQLDKNLGGNGTGSYNKGQETTDLLNAYKNTWGATFYGIAVSTNVLNISGRGHYVQYWSTTEFSASSSYNLNLSDDPSIWITDNGGGRGFPVRCVKN
jgi:uncharacterized protein (TIGR02145 family)